MVLIQWKPVLLNRYTNEQDILAHISRIGYMGMTTNTHAALLVMVTILSIFCVWLSPFETIYNLVPCKNTRTIIFQAVRDQCFGGPGDRPEARNVALIITDGVPFPPNRYQPTLDVAEELRMQNGKKANSPCAGAIIVNWGPWHQP